MPRGWMMTTTILRKSYLGGSLRSSSRRHSGIVRVALWLLAGYLLLPPQAFAQAGAAEPQVQADTEAETESDADTDTDTEDKVETEPPKGSSRSNYSETVTVAGGSKSVGAELVKHDQEQDVLFDINWTTKLFPFHYDRKRMISERSGIAFNVDYSMLSQYASYSVTEKDAASSVFRVFGQWRAFGHKDSWSGNLVIKYEHRGAIFGDQTPRDLGFNTGSALSTANYKENGWGMTDFYWKQVSPDAGTGFLLGHMDPGDWADQHSLLNAWTALMNDAFYNNPTEAIPKRTFSLVGRLGLKNNWYTGGGIHDANGKDNEPDFTQVFDTPELFTWIELGSRSQSDLGVGDTTHVHYWHQDERVAAGVEESWGVTFSSSRTFSNEIVAVVRAGYAEGDASQMREFLGVAVSIPARGSDTFKFGLGWGAPPDRTLRSQTVVELQYRLNVTQTLTVSPDLMVTFNPSFINEKDIVYVFGLRMRLIL